MTDSERAPIFGVFVPSHPYLTDRSAPSLCRRRDIIAKIIVGMLVGLERYAAPWRFGPPWAAPEIDAADNDDRSYSRAVFFLLESIKIQFYPKKSLFAHVEVRVIIVQRTDSARYSIYYLCKRHRP